MRDALARAGLHRQLDAIVWKRAWTVHIQPIGRGEHAALYLSRYVYRVALTNQRLERFEHGRVTFRYTHARTHETRRMTLPVNVSSRASSNTYFHAASPRSAPTAS
jgi:hypothetical protein